MNQINKDLKTLRHFNYGLTYSCILIPIINSSAQKIIYLYIQEKEMKLNEDPLTFQLSFSMSLFNSFILFSLENYICLHL